MTNQKTEKKNKKNWIAVLCIFLALAIVGSGACALYFANKNGFFEHHRTVLSMKNDDISINSAKFAYYFELAYEQAAKENSSELNDSKSLKTLKYTASDEYDTWYDYLVDKAKTNLIQSVCLAKKAKDEGMSLDSIGGKTVENAMNAFTSDSAKSAEYIGVYLTEDELRECMEMNELAEQYLAKYNSSLKFAENDIESQYAKSPEKYGKVTLKSYIFETDCGNETVLKDLFANAKTNAEKLAKTKNESEFNTVLAEYLKQYHKLKNDGADDEYIKAEINDTKKDDLSYKKGDELCEWAFSGERKSGECKLFDYGNGCYEVYMVVEPVHKDETVTRNIRLILSSKEQYDDDYANALTAAQSIKSMIQHSDDPEKEFSQLAVEYSADTYSVRMGGLYENVKKGDLDPKLIEWCYYDKRKAGDCDVVKIGNGYSTVYYIGNGVPSWQIKVISDLKEQSLKKLVDDLSKQYGVEFNDYNAKKVG